jgi:putative ubiquitin-RnfH superfamily antitoxin RatB of RatAB toxin-antitoxin module
MKYVRVEVVYALRDEQKTVSLHLYAGATVQGAITASGLLEHGAATDVNASGAGIWGKRVPLDQILRDGDRVEIYRPLLADPKVSRRDRARTTIKRRRGD